MPNTINVGISVDQSQVQQAVSTIQQATSGIQGSSWARGYNITTPIIPTPGGVSGSRGSISIFPAGNPVRSFADNVQVPFAQITASVNQLVGTTMSQLSRPSSNLDQLIKAGLPDIKSSMGTRMMATGAKTAVSLGMYEMEAKAGSWLGMGIGSMLGGPAGAGIGATAGSFIVPLVSNFIPGYSSFKNNMYKFINKAAYGDDFDEIGTKGQFVGLLRGMRNQTIGMSYTRMLGFAPSDFIGQAEISSFNKDIKGFFDVARQGSRSLLTHGDIISGAVGYSLFSRKGAMELQSLSRTLDVARHGDHVAQVAARNKATKLVRQLGEYSEFKMRYGMTDSDMVTAHLQTKIMLSSRRKHKSVWRRMGESIGASVGYKKSWGKDWFSRNSYIRKQALTDLLLTKEQKKLLGGARGIAYAFGKDVFTSFYAGGNTPLLAPLMKGNMFGSIHEWSGDVAASLATPEDQINFEYDKYAMVKKMGPKALTAAYRKVELEKYKEFAIEAGIDTKNTSYLKLGTVYNMHRYGMNFVEAKARTSMVLGLGDKIIYRGRKRKLYAFSSFGEKSNGYAAAVKNALKMQFMANRLYTTVRGGQKVYASIDTPMFDRSVRNIFNTNNLGKAIRKVFDDKITDKDEIRKIFKKFGLNTSVTAGIINDLAAGDSRRNSLTVSKITQHLVFGMTGHTQARLSRMIRGDVSELSKVNKVKGLATRAGTDLKHLILAYKRYKKTGKVSELQGISSGLSMSPREFAQEIKKYDKTLNLMGKGVYDAGGKTAHKGSLSALHNLEPVLVKLTTVVRQLIKENQSEKG